jgi:hypothetical protein
LASFRASWRFSFSLRLIRLWRKRDPEFREVDVGRLISDGEWLGKKVEEEIDRARRNKLEDESRDS